MSNRRAFGLIELLVVFAVLAILFALLVPALQRVLEAANRTNTINNMKQCAIAVHTYTPAACNVPGKALEIKAAKTQIASGANDWLDE